MRDNSNFVDRRNALQAITALVSSAALSGCGLLVRKPVPVCPNSPEVSQPDGTLTIDAHCHVFNGSDLQIEEFLTLVLAKQAGLVGVGARAIAPLLQHVGWEVAPTGVAEMNQLQTLSKELKTCSPQEHRARVVSLRNGAYVRGREQLRSALAKSAELQRFRQNLQLNGLDMHADEVTRARADLIAAIDALPEHVGDYKAVRSNPRLELLAHQKTARGMLDFVLQNFQYRYVSVYDYLETYNKAGGRFIDLMLPSIVDYDFWLAKGGPTPTPLDKQVEVMRQISVVTGGRVHAFVPFDPLRQVAFKLGHTSTDSYTLATGAIERSGCVGVKLYPPMGFAPLGNAKLKGEDGGPFWRRKWLPDWAARPDLGGHLDDAMRLMLNWCERNEVPVMAHTNTSNGPSADFEALAGSCYWAKALEEFKRLRISFGHFGDSSLGDDGPTGVQRARGFTALMGSGVDALGRNAYADAAYFVEGLLNRPELLAALRQLYDDTSPGHAPLASRFMYGTDWDMTLTEGNVIDNYLNGFVALFKDMESRPAIQSQGVAGLSERFFGRNAVEWIGLRKSQRARDRLDKFYATTGVPTPDWMAKVDKLGA